MPHDLAVEYVPVAELRNYYRNPRKGDVAAIQKSLRVNGQYRAVVANRGSRTGRENEVLAGNHTLMAAREEGWETLAVTFVDVDEDQATRITAADNRTADLGTYDDRLLVEMLGDLPDLDGTGYDPGDYDALVALLNQAKDTSADSDQDILDEADRAGWPTIKAQVPPDVYERWQELPGEDDADRVRMVLNKVGV